MMYLKTFQICDWKYMNLIVYGWYECKSEVGMLFHDLDFLFLKVKLNICVYIYIYIYIYPSTYIVEFIDSVIIELQHFFQKGRSYSSNPMRLIIIKHQLFLTTFNRHSNHVQSKIENREKTVEKREKHRGKP